MTKVLSPFVLLLAFWPTLGSAGATRSCWPNYNAINQRLTVQNGEVIKVPVLQDSQGQKQSRTYLEVIENPESTIFRLQFYKHIGELGLPQNVYALLILNQNGYPLHFEDFTGGCQGPGLSFFPGQSLEIFKLKQDLETAKQLQIILWSR